ncbi:transglycosylase family protein [Streptomyces gobiensis]|uniref:transglycosylase family protein n=1 Tax=Streptomyces gobiensis TaxID=2875706 RepID=UPI0024113E1D|nr:transglycosylase family protein [Streptomyces gobiensis]
MPLLGASGAQAAEAATWDRVAECESGGIWSSNAENGYYGGLQLTLSTWEKYGGTVYADRPDLASRMQQIAVAEQILAEQGPDAWPSCAVGSGLAKEVADGAVEVPEAVPSDDPLSPAPTPSPDRLETESPAETPAETPAESSAEDGAVDEGPGDEGAQPGEPGQDGATAPDHPSLTPDHPAPGSAEGTGKHRGEPETERPSENTARGADRVERGSGDYRVQSGDSLSEIAEREGVQGGWPALYAANEPVIGADPDLILPGQRLDLGQQKG